MTDKLSPKQRAAAALRNMCVADSLAMPVHWYYRTTDIERQFPGGITRLEAAPEFHPSSIMSLHSTNQGGRGPHGTGNKRQIVGDVILKGKRLFWGKANQHYHQGMNTGENTLNAHCARMLMRTLIANQGRYDTDDFLDAYIELMTADPPQHRDTYAESYHRGFFANLQRGKAKDSCGAVTHDTPSIGGLVTIAPIVFAERLQGTPLADVQTVCRQHLWLTHPDDSLAKVCDHYTALLNDLLFAGPEHSPQAIIAKCAKQSLSLNLPDLISRAKNDSDVVGARFSTACYISGSFPSVLYLAYKYHSEPKMGLLANTNLGGDNVHRGALLGILLGLANGTTVAEFYAGLRDKTAIEKEILGLLNCI